jgi:uncharacterized protein involved in response to NO
MGGRIIPMFTRNAVPGIELRPRPLVDYLALVCTVSYLVGDFVSETATLTALFAIVAGSANLLRLSTWKSRATCRNPILWVLHVGYFFLAWGLIARGASFSFFPMMTSVPIHLLTAGAMGILILGMISRVALGHTGRPILASTAITLAYIVVILGALVRVLTPLVAPTFYRFGMAGAAALWAAGFLIFAIQYWPILTRPRVDGLEG